MPVQGAGWSERDAPTTDHTLGRSGLEIIDLMTTCKDTLKTETIDEESVLDQKISIAEGLGFHDNPLLCSKQR